jgi:LmbE family N-acetylglucosaminyl deacetylase
MQITSKTKFLVISPHPDDEALGIGGLIGKVLKEKGKVMIYYLTVGDSRQLVTGETNSKTRLKEIEAVRKLTGANIKVEYIGEEFCRLDTVPQKDLIEKVEDAIELFKPDIVGVPSYNSYNQDHRELYTACITALRPTPKNIRHFTPTVLEYGEPYRWGVNPNPGQQAFIDLSQKYKKGSLLDFKIRLYKCHKTQVRTGVFARSPENLIHEAHIVGREIGVEIAECYRILRTEIF